LHDLKRNPSFQQYEFWPLMADATVIVQHLCSVTIFICCFVGIRHKRVSPVSVVSWGTFGTILGWLLWDFWVGQEEVTVEPESATPPSARSTSSRHSRPSQLQADGTASEFGFATRAISKPVVTPPLASSSADTGVQGTHANGTSPDLSSDGTHSAASGLVASKPGSAYGESALSTYDAQLLDSEHAPSLSRRYQQRLATVKSAILIYCALLGLSPILKSLTMSTTSDSIWAMSCWLMCINIFFFDYGGAPGAK
jgi:phosphatidylinositol N-acetylglucosaminyltransferase subunit C